MARDAEKARQQLRAWQQEQPADFFAADPYLQASLQAIWGQSLYEERLEELHHLGQTAASLESQVSLNHRNHNLPRLAQWDGIGERTKAIEHHPSYAAIGRALYGSGQLRLLGEPGNWLYSLSLFYLGAQLGEAGHNCPIACTAGVIKALQAAGNPEQQARSLPGLLNTEFGYCSTGAQFLTEVQGGSDVGANAVQARPMADGRYAIHGEKWFCSNAGADLILITARVEGAGSGTRGLSLFLMNRQLDDGQPNHYRIRRLKDKLGTRTMASAEIDFEGAVAECLGDLESGFQTAMTQVIHTSRLYNAFACLGYAQRALHIARGYARHRQAFGQAIIAYPLVQQSLATMSATVAAQKALALHLAELQDRSERQELSEQGQAALRVLVNLNKSRNAELCRTVIQEGLSVLGGNGAIESFSAMPRLLRDVVVCENWEGTHNTLYAQCLRDFGQRQLHQPLLDHLSSLLDGLSESGSRPVLMARMEQLKHELDNCLEAPNERASLQSKQLCQKLADLAAALCLARQGEIWPLRQQPEDDPSPELLLEQFLCDARPENVDLERLEALA